MSSLIKDGNFDWHQSNPDYGSQIPGVQRMQQRMGDIDAEIASLEASKVIPTGFLGRASANSQNNKIDSKITLLKEEQLAITREMRTFLEDERNKNIGADSPEDLHTNMKDLVDRKGQLEASIAEKKSEKESYDDNIEKIRAFNDLKLQKDQEIADLKSEKTSLGSQITRKNTEISSLENEINNLNASLNTADAIVSKSIVMLISQKESEKITKENELDTLQNRLDKIDDLVIAIDNNLNSQRDLILNTSGFNDIRAYLNDLQTNSDRIKKEIAPEEAEIKSQDDKIKEIERQRKLHETNNPNIVSINGELAGINADINVNRQTETFRQKLLRLWRS